ncbi:MAG: hypothetical protein K2Q25_10480 [Mycobacteriaceae bacterium]|nr:hypothetical protein [Mycobacteriaceae bacterium]
MQLPAPRPPLVQMRALGAERGVITMAGVDNGVVIEAVKDLRLDAVQ